MEGGEGSFVFRSLVPRSTLYPPDWGESGEDILVAHRAGKMKKEHAIY